MITTIYDVDNTNVQIDPKIVLSAWKNIKDYQKFITLRPEYQPTYINISEIVGKIYHIDVDENEVIVNWKLLDTPKSKFLTDEILQDLSLYPIYSFNPITEELTILGSYLTFG